MECLAYGSKVLPKYKARPDQDSWTGPGSYSLVTSSNHDNSLPEGEVEIPRGTTSRQTSFDSY